MNTIMTPEMEIIGGIIVTGKMADDVANFDTWGSISVTAQKILRHCKSLHKDGNLIDEASLTGNLTLEYNGIVPKHIADYILDATWNTKVNDLEGQLTYLEIIKRNLVKEKSAKALAHASQKVTDGTITESDLSKVSNVLDRVSEREIEFSGISEIFTEVSDRLDKLEKFNGKPETSTGYSMIDEMTMGFEDGEMYIIAARPAMGKSAFALNMATKVARERPVIFLSLEMGTYQIGNRLLANEGSVDYSELQRGCVNPEAWNQVIGEDNSLANSLLQVKAKGAITPSYVRNCVKSYMKKNPTHKTPLVIIDYIQLMACEQKSLQGEQKIATISIDLKGLAMDFGLPLVVLAQLNRGLEGRDNKRPLLSDLRGSGQLEQDASVVMSLFRQAQYETDGARDGLTDVEILKNRNGTCGIVTMNFIGKYQRFLQMDDHAKIMVDINRTLDYDPLSKIKNN